MAALPARAAYELWAETYASIAHNPLMRVEQAVVEPLLTRQRARRALDVGSGSGRYGPVLASTGAAIVASVDFSLAMLRRCGAGFHPSTHSGCPEPVEGHACDRRAAAFAPEALRRASPELAGTVGEQRREAPHHIRPRICADACALPFRRATFDLINASLMVGDVADLGAWSREMARVLATGGHLVYSDFHPTWATSGWQRTFRTGDGRIHDVAFHPHSIDDHLAALADAGLYVQAIREPRFGDDPDPAVKAFQRRWDNPQVVVVFHAVKER